MKDPIEPDAASLLDLDATDLSMALRSGSVTATDLASTTIARIDASDYALRAWVSVDGKRALEDARQRDDDLYDQLTVGALHGVPVGVKDIIDVAGMPTGAGSAAFTPQRPARDAALVARLRSAGAVIMGKTVTTAFAFTDPASTRNPWSPLHTPGGSSSGSAAAVAARHVPVAIGTQTVGSTLRPAAYCGVVGLKGAHAAVPLTGVVPLAPTLDHAGIFARSVRDAALVLSVISASPANLVEPENPRIGVSSALLGLATEPLRRHLDGVIEQIARSGARIVEISLPESFADLREAGFCLLAAEAAASHDAIFRRRADEYEPRIRDLIEHGRAIEPVALRKAYEVRESFRASIIPVLLDLDALLSPVASGPAPLRSSGTGDSALCAPWSTAGVPSISIPTGLDPAGLPLAVQLSGAPAGLDRLLGTAAFCEATLAFDAHPPA